MRWSSGKPGLERGIDGGVDSRPDSFSLSVVQRTKALRAMPRAPKKRPTARAVGLRVRYGFLY